MRGALGGETNICCCWLPPSHTDTDAEEVDDDDSEDVVEYLLRCRRIRNGFVLVVVVDGLRTSTTEASSPKLLKLSASLPMLGAIILHFPPAAAVVVIFIATPRSWHTATIVVVAFVVDYATAVVIIVGSGLSSVVSSIPTTRTRLSYRRLDGVGGKKSCKSQIGGIVLAGWSDGTKLAHSRDERDNNNNYY
jgi:hypothetical protein